MKKLKKNLKVWSTHWVLRCVKIKTMRLVVVQEKNAKIAKIAVERGASKPPAL